MTLGTEYRYARCETRGREVPIEEALKAREVGMVKAIEYTGGPLLDFDNGCSVRMLVLWLRKLVLSSSPQACDGAWRAGCNHAWEDRGGEALQA